MEPFRRTNNAVYRIVCSLCKDYDRRAREVRKGEKDAATLLHYVHLNDVIDLSIASACEEGIRQQMREDIGNGVGYRRTQLYYIAEGTYKTRKRASIEAIARNLHLI